MPEAAATTLPHRDPLINTLAKRHGMEPDVIEQFKHAVEMLIASMDEPRSYRRIVTQTHRVCKIALWLASHARTQAQFRRFFGKAEHEKPTKSVAHQVYYEVFPKDAEEHLV